MKKINIIGAGIAGLCAGCYGQINGYETEIFEMHNIPGGMCTAWERKGFTIDGCIEWLMGTIPSSPFYKLWNEIGALNGREFIIKDEFMVVEDSKGQKLTFYADINKTEAEMIRMSPEDAPLIRQMADAVRKITGLSTPVDKPRDMYTFIDIAKLMIKMGPNMGTISKLNKISIGEFASKFKSPFLREALTSYIDEEYTLFIFLMILATYNSGDGAWCVGGSLEFAKGIEKRYLELGGKINYKTKVESIMIENNRAVGIKLEDGSQKRSDYVISAADGYTTIFKMLNGAYVNDKIKALYENTPLSSSSVQISLGINCDLSDRPYSLVFKPHHPIISGGNEYKYLQINHFSYDKTMCPPGKSVTRGNLFADYDYWEKLYNNDKDAYKAEKDRIAQEYIKAVEEKYPEVRGNIEVVDVATPVTYKRYTGNWKGIYMSWKTTVKNPMMVVPNSLPGLESFYMAGQWANSSGGIPVGVMTGRFCIMKICKEDRKKMVTSGCNRVKVCTSNANEISG